MPERGSGRRPNRSARPGPRPGNRPLRKGNGEKPRTPRSLLEEVRSVSRPGRAEQAATAFERAVNLLERGRDVAAVAEAQEAKALAPRSGAAREVLGIALYRTQRYREALRELQAYRRITGRLDQNHLIADSHRALGAPEKAVEPARQAMWGRIPEEARVEAAVVGASALADMGRFGEALGLLRGFPASENVARQFELRLWYVTGDILERAGRRAEAREEFRRVVRHDPQAFDAAERLARLE